MKNQELNIEDLVKELNPRENLDNPFSLTNDQKQILDSYGIKIDSSLERLIFDIEDYLNTNYDYDNEDLELIADNLKDYHYYKDMKK